MSNLKPFLVTSRYGNFNDYIKTRFSKLIEDKFSLENESTNMCICPSCEGYCNTLNKKECENEESKCLWYTKTEPKCKTVRTTLFCNCDKKYAKKTGTGMMIHQQFLSQYMEIHNITKQPYSKGLLIYHGLGSGKTRTGIILSNIARSYIIKDKVFKRKIIIMIPANLNLDPWIKELSSDFNFNTELRNDLNQSRKINKKKSDKEQIRLYKKICKKHDVHIIHYNADGAKGGWRSDLKSLPTRKKDFFTNKYNNDYKEDDSSRFNPFDDSVVIIDEVHNLSNNFASNYEDDKKKRNSKVNLIYHQFLQSENSKIFLLTGTPIINKPYELIFLLNMVRGKVSYKNKSLKFKEDGEFFENRFFKNIKNEWHIKNERLFKSRINGLVSYYSGINKEVFADKIFREYTLLMKGRFKYVYMNSWKQESLITKDISEDTDEIFSTHVLSQQASNFCYPAWIFSINEQKKMNLLKDGKKISLNKIFPHVMTIRRRKYTFEGIPRSEQRNEAMRLLDTDDKFLHIDNKLKEYSQKMYVIVRKIIQSNGPVLVYSKFKGGYGISILCLALEQNGFVNYDKCRKNNCITKDKSVHGSYMTWTPETRKDELRSIYNSYENRNGDIIKVFLMTEAGKEGINLVGVRQVHILEPWWNNVVDRQVIGRAIRICSHAHIDKSSFKDFTKKVPTSVNKWLVNVFKYSSMTTNKKGELDPKSSIDIRIKNTANLKREKENKIVKLLQEQSLDCWLYNSNEDQTVKIDGICDNRSKLYDNFVFWEIDDNDDYKKSDLFKVLYNDRDLWVIKKTNVVLMKYGIDNYRRVGVYNQRTKKITIDNYDNSYILPIESITNQFPGTKNQRQYIRTDEQGLHSVTRRADGKIVEKYIKYLYTFGSKKFRNSLKNGIAIDLTLGIGGDSIAFSKFFKTIYSFEINPIRCQMAKENLTNVLNLQNVNIRCTDSITIINNFKKYLKYIGVEKVQLIHGDFPWGGIDYKKEERIKDLYLEEYDWDYKTDSLKPVQKRMGLYEMIKKIIKYTSFISLKLPFNFDLEYMEKKLKTKIHVYPVSKKMNIVIIDVGDNLQTWDYKDYRD